MSSAQGPTPDAPAEEQTLWDKLGTALPIGLAALATVFAGMSSRQLQKAMFWRTPAGQDQARATNQWTYAGLKKNRALIMGAAAAELAAKAPDRRVDFASIASKDEKQAAEWLVGKDAKGK